MRVSASMSSRSPSGDIGKHPPCSPWTPPRDQPPGRTWMNSSPVAARDGDGEIGTVGADARGSRGTRPRHRRRINDHRRVVARNRRGRPTRRGRRSPRGPRRGGVDVAEADVVKPPRAFALASSSSPSSRRADSPRRAFVPARKPYCGFVSKRKARHLSPNSGSTSTRTDPSFASHLPRFTMSWPNRAASRQVAICPPATETSPRRASPLTPPRLKKSGRAQRTREMFPRPLRGGTSRRGPQHLRHHREDVARRIEVERRAGGARPHPVVCDSRWRVVTSRHRARPRSSGWRRSRARGRGIRRAWNGDGRRGDAELVEWSVEV